MDLHATARAQSSYRQGKRTVGKPIRVILIDEAKEVFDALERIVSAGELNGDELRLIKSIRQKIEVLKSDPFYGDNIPKALIPRDLPVQNVWRVELANYWRMLYTIKGDESELICFITHILDHRTYDKLFGYRKR